MSIIQIFAVIVLPTVLATGMIATVIGSLLEIYRQRSAKLHDDSGESM